MLMYTDFIDTIDYTLFVTIFWNPVKHLEIISRQSIRSHQPVPD